MARCPEGPGRRDVEAALYEAQERLLAALGAAEMGALDLDPATGAFHLDDRCKSLLDFSPADDVTLEGLLSKLDPEDQQQVQAAVAHALDPAGTGDFEVELRIHPPGEDDRWVAARGRVLVETGKPPRVVGIAYDVTLRHHAEQLMREALEHKDMLVREVSHRVKNSLQLVAGMLALQARATEHEEVREALTVAQSRVQAIGQVHDQLWRQAEMQEVELAEFLRSLCEKLEESAPTHHLVFEGVRALLATDRAISVALLVNELVTNAFKHAYPEGEGEVRVHLAADGERLRIEVKDFGVGLPAGAELADTGESLGMRVVNGLVRQLRADLDVVADTPGSRFVLRFDPVEPAADAAA